MAVPRVIIGLLLATLLLLMAISSITLGASSVKQCKAKRLFATYIGSNVDMGVTEYGKRRSAAAAAAAATRKAPTATSGRYVPVLEHSCSVAQEDDHSMTPFCRVDVRLDHQGPSQTYTLVKISLIALIDVQADLNEGLQTLDNVEAVYSVLAELMLGENLNGIATLATDTIFDAGKLMQAFCVQKQLAVFGARACFTLADFAYSYKDGTIMLCPAIGVKLEVILNFEVLRPVSCWMVDVSTIAANVKESIRMWKAREV